MNTTITRVQFLPKLEKKLRVAAYARVSSGKDAMLHSLSSQIGYYNEHIQKRSDWSFAGVYADEAVTGTKENRSELQRLLTDCRSGLIDLVLTKSISRFARNTVTLLETVRELKALRVDVFFEEQNLHSLSKDGELLLTILASYAQEESLSVSENQKWRIRSNFKQGKAWNSIALGYHQKAGYLFITPSEAETVRSIYADYLSGLGYTAIANKLNKACVTTRRGCPWKGSSVAVILRNYTYTGNLLLQTRYRENHITKRSLRNTGELPKYHAEETHEPIVTMDTFMAVQMEMRKRDKKYGRAEKQSSSYPFSGMLICEMCGDKYRRKKARNKFIWVCHTYNTCGKEACASVAIQEDILLQTTADVLHTSEITAELLHELLVAIRVCSGNRLIYAFKDNTVKEYSWEKNSRAASWSLEKRQAAGKKTSERNAQLCRV